MAARNGRQVPYRMVNSKGAWRFLPIAVRRRTNKSRTLCDACVSFEPLKRKLMAAPGFGNSPLRLRGRFILTQYFAQSVGVRRQLLAGRACKLDDPISSTAEVSDREEPCLTQQNVEIGPLNVSSSRRRRVVRCNELFCSTPRIVGSRSPTKPSAILRSKNMKTLASRLGARGLRREATSGLRSISHGYRLVSRTDARPMCLCQC
jgi:hypothetical protein